MSDGPHIHENHQKPESIPHPDLHKPGDDWLKEVLDYLKSGSHTGSTDANQMFGNLTLYDGGKKG